MRFSVGGRDTPTVLNLMDFCQFSPQGSNLGYLIISAHIAALQQDARFRFVHTPLNPQSCALFGQCEPISYPINCLDDTGAGRIFFDLLAETADRRLEQFRRVAIRESPNSGQQLRM